MFGLLTLQRPLALSIGLTSALIGHQLLLRPSQQHQHQHQQRLSSLLYSHCSTSSAPISSSDWSYSQNAKTPLRQNGRWNPRAIRQISAGSIIGFVGGLAVSTFSRPLALLIGLLFFGVHFLESRGIHIIPYSRLQGYAKSIDMRSAMQDNLAWKLAFGATFSLAAFAEF